ncbi:MAG TPA: four-carbon acid sugar kinase family protein [Actinomycetes bacterium]|nr:four-carbon acid sugar kinase family protein [Actinomycetes bacterium]
MLVIGDDMTGANATGALFARRGLRTVCVAEPANLARFAREFDVLVIDIASRHLPAEEAAQRARAAVAASGQVQLVIKRVDTTLRGNVGAELDAALEQLRKQSAYARVRAIMVPAFPTAGRTTVGGIQLVDGIALTETDAARDPLDPVRSSRVASIVAAQTDRSIAEVPLDLVLAGRPELLCALRQPVDVVICDALTTGHLRTIAEVAAQVAEEDGLEWLSVDPGPFGAELAECKHLGRAAEPPPILLVSGSLTRLTRDQLLEVERLQAARFIDVDPGQLDVGDVVRRLQELLAAAPAAGVLGIRAAPGNADVQSGAEVARHIPEALSEIVRLVLADRPVGGLYVTGGDVTVRVMAALGAHGIELEEEVLPLAVAGRLQGGPHSGLPFTTKGGLIGGPLAAVACVEHTRRLARRWRDT